jgi:hypothetical protein
MSVTLLKTPAVFRVGVPASFSQGMFFDGSGDGEGIGAEPSTCEPSKLARNGPLP